jgi:hypothetical protein
MTTTIQHESHPGAESLAAFAEQALGAHERGQILAHLAICSRCRQIVALASDAAAEAAPTTQVAVRPRRAWWQGWGLALAPTVALAATVAGVAYLHMHRATPDNQTAKVEPPAQIAPNNAPVANTSTTAPTANFARPKPSNAAPAVSSRESIAAPHAQAEGIIARVEEAPAPSVAAPAPLNESRAVANNLVPAPAQTAVDAWQQEQKSAPSAATRVFASKSAAPSKLRDVQTNASGNNALAVNNNALTDVTAGAAAFNNQANSFAAMEVAPTAKRMKKAKELPAILLPSGLPAVSVTNSGSLTLALDATGALYLRPLAGAAWQRIAPQWTGHAVLVRRQAAPGGQENGEDKARSYGITAAAPAKLLEIVNDQNQVWLSTDGKTWSAK